jgi:hypothetical protein
MNSPNPKDLLSAFYDREVAPEEEAAAQAQVQRSPEARGEVKDYARLSRLLQQLPQVKAPAEFAAAVMRRAESESLIPLDPVVTRPAAAPSPVVPRRRRWILAGAAAASVAAIGWLAITFSGRSEPRGFHAEPIADQRLDSVDNSVNNAKGRKVAVGFDEAAKPSRDAAALTRREVPADRAATNAPTGARLAARDPATTLGPVLGKAGAAPALSVPLAAGRSRESALMLPANLKTAQVGDVVEALQQDGQQVAVVRLTVVNQVEGLDGVLSVLVRNTSRTLQNADEIKRLRQQFGADRADTRADAMPKAAVGVPSGDFICVYVEGSRDEMVRVLHDLQNESHIRAAELTNTISVKALEQYANQAVPGQKEAGERVAADKLAPSSRASQDPAKSSGSQMAVSLPAATVDKILSANPVPAAVAGGHNSRPEATSEQVVQQPPATPAPASPAAKEKASTSGETVAGQSAKVARRGARAGSRSTAKQPDPSDLFQKPEIASSGKSFQIFFVITDQAPAPPASATTKPSAKPAPAAATAPVPVWSSPKKRTP